MVFSWVAIVIVIVLAARFVLGGSWTRDISGRSGTEDSALDILKTRYARGEISEAEYLRMKSALEA